MWYGIRLYDEWGRGWPYLWGSYDKAEAEMEADKLRARKLPGCTRVEVVQHTKDN